VPIYEFQCSSCGHRLEVMQKISDRSPRKCPECGRMKLRKLISPVAFRLKGSGWYETGFKDKSARKKLADDKAETKTGSKPETKDKPAVDAGKEKAKPAAKKAAADD
jgi:putative FmdB family regulatory protein